MSTPESGLTFRFGDFELDPLAYSLRLGTRRIRLEGRPMELLLLLVEHAGQLVSRDRIVERLWGRSVFVDTEAGVNTAIRKIRRALKDVAGRPAYVETVPGKGYRFIAAVASCDVRDRVTLCVLPYANLTGDASRQYIADGLTEETIAALGQVADERLRVLGRTSSTRLAHAALPIEQIGRRMGADYLVESSVRGEAKHLRVTSRLIRASDQAQVWSASYDSDPIDLLRLQSELSAAIAGEIRVRLATDRVSRLQRRQTHSAAAYDWYLRGRQAWNQLTPASTRQAIECFGRATALDDRYALAWSGIADALATGPIAGDADPRLVRARAAEAATQAVRTHPDLAEAHASVGTVRFWLDWAWPAADAAFRRAISLDPHYPFAFRMLGHVLSQTGQHRAARLALRRACELDPFYAMHHALSAQVAFQARDFPAAVEHARQALEVEPQFWVGHIQLAQAYVQLGEPDRALDAVEAASRLSAPPSKTASLKGYVLARTGRVDEARAVLDALESSAREGFVPPYAMALVSLGIGDVDAAYAWLNRAEAARDVHLVFLPVDPKWDGCRADPRFDAVLGRCGFVGGGAPAREPG